MGEQPAKTPQTAVEIFSQGIEGQTRQQDQRSRTESSQPDLKELIRANELELEWMRRLQQEGVTDLEQEGRSKEITQQNVQMVSQLQSLIGQEPKYTHTFSNDGTSRSESSTISVTEINGVKRLVKTTNSSTYGTEKNGLSYALGGVVSREYLTTQEASNPSTIYNPIPNNK